jgi:glutamate-1-semialdehyde 2,1-aminomutase
LKKYFNRLKFQNELKLKFKRNIFYMPLKRNRSIELFSQAQELFPGGVNSPVRAFKAVGGKPLFISWGEGPYLYDEEGNRYIDYVLSWGPLILGHAHPNVVEAINQAAALGTSFGAPSKLEIKLAELIKSFMPNLEKIRFVNSGTEATMTALRLARAFSGRNKIIKFEGNYHGHADLLLVQAGSGVATLGLPDSPGVPPATVQDTLVSKYNDLQSVARLFDEYPRDVAAVILEPVAGNMGVIPPEKDFLKGLREITSDHSSLLIFDEVMTGFRVHPGGAQALYGIKPDLSTLGKVIGGGLPVGAYGGRSEIMEMIAPSGPVYQAGTLSGNPLAMSAGIATLSELKHEGIWKEMKNSVDLLTDGISQAAESAAVPIQQNRVGTMFSTFFTSTPVRDWNSAKTSDAELFSRFFGGMLEGGVYLAPSQFEAGFMSSVHDKSQIENTILAAEQSLRTLI